MTEFTQRDFTQLSPEDFNLYFAGSCLRVVDKTLPDGIWVNMQKCKHAIFNGTSRLYEFLASVPIIALSKSQRRTLDIADGAVKVSATKLLAFRCDETQINFSYPTAGWYSFRGTAIHFARLAERNSKRGINSATCFFHNFLTPFRVAGLFTAKAYSVHTYGSLVVGAVHTIFDGGIPKPEMAVLRVRRKHAWAQAISHNLVIAQGLDHQGFDLWNGQMQRVAKVATDLKQIDVAIKNSPTNLFEPLTSLGMSLQ